MKSERNALVVHLWNTTDMTVGQLADKIGASNAIICGIIQRARKRGQITRPKRSRNRLALSRVNWAHENKGAVAKGMVEAILALRHTQCLYPIIEGGRFSFCEEERDGDRTYCAHHHRLCHAK